MVWPRLLEVGALKADNYRGCSSWIENTPIDLNVQGPGIRQQDFLQMSEDENTCKWDVLSLSLVLNFVPDPRERGRGILFAGIWFTPHFQGGCCSWLIRFLTPRVRVRASCSSRLVSFRPPHPPGNQWLIIWCSSPCHVCKIRATSLSTILRV